MTKYNISFIRNEVYQSLIDEARSKDAVEDWFAEHKPDARVLNIREAWDGDMKPGKPIIEIY